ncbi:MAG: LytR C-terminal domain-containing protein [Fibrobacterota bacterium]
MGVKKKDSIPGRFLRPFVPFVKTLAGIAAVGGSIYLLSILGSIRSEQIQEEEKRREALHIEKKEKTHILPDQAPREGYIKVLNGCGVTGVAGQAAEILRKNNYRTSARNARSHNYKKTMVLERKAGTTVAEEAAEILGTDPPLLLRPSTGDTRHDATVIIGHDYERILYD